MDLVESVRLMTGNERAVVDHWRGFVRHAQTDVLPNHRGRMVKSLGDGIMAEFDSPRDATQAATRLHHYFDGINASLPETQQYFLRAGLNTAQVYIDELDIYGSGVNLAARVAALAGPGETMATAEVRDGLTDGLDAQVEDMGECHLKHVAEPVRAFRVGMAGPAPILTTEIPILAQLPTIVVIPLSARQCGPEFDALGELVADGVIAQLSKTAELCVVSRLASSALRHNGASSQNIRSLVQADFALTGSYTVHSGRVLILAQLVDASSNVVVWSDRLSGDVLDLLQPQSEICDSLAQAAHRGILAKTAEKISYTPLPTLPAQALMFAGAAGVHQISKSTFLSGGKALQAVIDRHPKHADAYAWLAKWYAIGTNRGLTDQKNKTLALNLADAAVQRNPENSFAHAVQGLTNAFFVRNLDQAKASYARALSLNPNDSLAWLYTGTLNAWQGNVDQAAMAAKRALKLTPIGSAQYYFESLAAFCIACAGNHEESIRLCRRSLRQNALHSATHRMLIISLVLNHQVDEARTLVHELMQLEPTLSAESFLRRYVGRDQAHAQTFADALAIAGIPRH